MAKVVIENLLKIFPEKSGPGVRAVNEINLAIEDREFMVLVGPSGCGKSTTLRMIAGLEEITGGTIAIDGRVVNQVLPKDRDIAMVFQNYALYPHMSVYDNMAFGLKLRGLPKAAIAARVQEAAALLGLEAYLQRKPKALSGGQRQRVAVGRAIVRKPKVFLFDEPLSNLDAKMRVSTRTEISKLHARLGATMIYVTHDQVEAMTMGDRICVMKDGNIMQVAEPLALYRHPENLFVAGFIGSPPMNLFKGTVAPDHGRLVFVEAGDPAAALRLALDDALAKKAAAHVGRPLVFGIRPENITNVPAAGGTDPQRTVEVNIEVVEPMGAETYLYLDTGANSFVARVRANDRFDPNQRLKVSFDVEKAHLFDAATEQVLP
ncbi:MAG TPA: sn-glycerol-3-phosphate ABC transporter ATP-binding protein UgpC [Opitutaceae bacterium]|nr:sn-glycerol-3-phosphate ABC transporter ATP-binding protein UgpC [Opitutaceae bacterium]